MATTTIPAFKAALKNALVADAALGGAGVQVTWGFPRVWEAEVVWLGDIEDWDQSWATIGNKARDETYTLVLAVNVVKPGGTQQEAEERAYALVAAVENVVRADPSFGNVVLWAEIDGGRQPTPPLAEESAEAQVEVGIAVRARI